MYYPKQPGTYCFWNTINNKVYVGSTKCLSTRLNQHFNNQNSRPILQDAIKKYSIKAFNITCVITETHAEALMQEQLILDYLFQNNVPKYNIAPIAGGGRVLNDYSNHAKSIMAGLTRQDHIFRCNKGGSPKPKKCFVLNIKNPKNIITFDSLNEVARQLNTSQGAISTCIIRKLNCFNAKNSRWVISIISKQDLILKFNSLTKKQIVGQGNRKFKLVHKITGAVSEIFTSVNEPNKKGYNITVSNLGFCFLGRRRTVNGYYVILML